MVAGMWGKKIGMTQLFSEKGVVPVTAIDISQWVVVGTCTQERDGYNAVRVARVRPRYVKNPFDASWLKKSSEYFSHVREIKLSNEASEFQIGAAVNADQWLAEGNTVDATGVSRGRGFAGVVKRLGFAGARASHGATMGKAPGAIGFMRTRGRVIKGKGMPGHLGAKQNTVRNLAVVKMDSNHGVIFVKGAVPGHKGSLVFLRKA